MSPDHDLLHWVQRRLSKLPTLIHEQKFVNIKFVFNNVKSFGNKRNKDKIQINKKMTVYYK